MKKFWAWITCGAFVLLLGICACLFWVAYPLKYKSTIVKYSDKYNLQPELVASVICVESRYKPKATSSAGASGLMQLMPSTYTWVQEELGLTEDIFNVDNNVQAGCYYLRHLLNKYNNLVYVLACYNAGEGVVATWGSSDQFDVGNIKYPETKNYVNRVLSLQKLYRSRFD